MQATEQLTYLPQIGCITFYNSKADAHASQTVSDCIHLLLTDSEKSQFTKDQ
jgi:hypothetical protein